MARFVDPTGTKFWKIERDGLFIVRRSGPVGKRGQTQRTPYVTRLLARFHLEQLVAQKLREGYTPVDDPPRPDDDFPFDSDARLVQGDLLQQKGDPLGELIALQHAGLDTSALIATHARTWFGDLAEASDVVRFEWRLGRLERATIAYDRHTRRDWISKVNSELLNVPYASRMATLLEALFDLPIARSLVELVVDIAETTDYRVTMQVLNEHAPPTLRRLEIDSDARNYPTGALLSPIHLPQLEELRSDLNLTAMALQHIGEAPWPKLHTLAIAQQLYEKGLKIEQQKRRKFHRKTRPLL